MTKQHIQNWIILLLLSVIWGSSFILMKKSLLGFNYIEVACFRLIIAFLCFVPWLHVSLKKLTLKNVIPLLIVSIIGTVIPAVLFALAQTQLGSALSGMLNGLTPVFTLIIGVCFFKTCAYIQQYLGLIICFVGTYILLGSSDNLINDTQFTILIIIATICYALSINTIKFLLNNIKALDIAVITSFFSAILPTLYIFSTGIINNIMKISNNTKSFFFITILGLLGTSIAIVLFNKLIKQSSALFASTTTYFIPIVAIIWGIIDQEKIWPHEILGIIIILVGIFTINTKEFN